MLETREREHAHHEDQPEHDDRTPVRGRRAARLRPRQAEDTPGERPDEACRQEAERRERHVGLDVAPGIEEAKEMRVQHVHSEQRRGAPGDQRVPRTGHHEDERRAARQVEVSPGEPAHQGQPQADDEKREQADEPLREHAEVEQQEPPAAPVGSLGVTQEAVDRQGEAEHEELVGRRLADVEGVADHRRHDDSGQEAGALPVESSPDAPGEEHRAEHRQRRPEARRPLGRAQEPEGQRRQPEVEGRLLEVGQPVRVGHHPIAVSRHLERDRRVEPLVGVEEGHAELHEEERCAEDEEQSEGRQAGRSTHVAPV